jgi:hypothetical protein
VRAQLIGINGHQVARWDDLVGVDVVSEGVCFTSGLHNAFLPVLADRV